MEAGAATRFKAQLPRPSVGDRFGALTVVDLEIGPAGGLRSVVCRCGCGRVGPFSVSNLRKGATTRCNVCAKKVARKTRDKLYYGYDDVVPDPEHRKRLLNRISACHGRCFNPRDPAYKNYGGRGISVYWGRDRRAFLEHLVTLDGWDDPSLDIDRIDVDGDYAPGNLRFITRQENARNKRKTSVLSKRVRFLEAENALLRARLRHLESGAEEPFHDPLG